jgi:hypothetical protein
MTPAVAGTFTVWLMRMWGWVRRGWGSRGGGENIRDDHSPRRRPAQHVITHGAAVA